MSSLAELCISLNYVVVALFCMHRRGRKLLQSLPHGEYADGRDKRSSETRDQGLFHGACVPSQRSHEADVASVDFSEVAGQELYECCGEDGESI
jgi:hypothetical protein